MRHVTDTDSMTGEQVNYWLNKETILPWNHVRAGCTAEVELGTGTLFIHSRSKKTVVVHFMIEEIEGGT